MDDGTRRNLDELLTQYELFPTTRDVIVEGREDASFFSNFLRDSPELADVTYNVYPVRDRVNLPPGPVLAAGVDDGERGRVLFLAAAATDWPDEQRLCITCVADADRAFVKDDLPISDVLLVTDFGSLECYALTPRVLSKFVAVVLRQEQPDGNSLLSAVQPLLIAVFRARAALHLAAVGLRLTADHIKKHSLEEPDLDVALIKRVLPQGQAGSELYAEVHAVLLEVRSKVPEDEPRKAIRGHDIAPVIVNHMKLKNDYAHPETVERSLMGCIERADVEGYPLFQNLIARVASAKSA